MGANVVFGFIDNAGLFFGGCYLDEVFSKLPGGTDANICAGYGNTFSDTLGMFLGTFFGIILKSSLEIDDGPIWANAFGITIGCLLGIYVPVLILGTDVKTTGLNKVSAESIVLGTMDINELKALNDGTITLLDFRCEKVFNKIDSNKSNNLDKNEIKNYFKHAMGSDFSEEKY